MTHLELKILQDLLQEPEKTAGPIGHTADKIISLPVAGLSRIFRAPIDALFGSTGKGIYEASRFRPRHWTSWKPVTEAEAAALRLVGRGSEVGRAGGQSIQKSKGFGGLAGVVQRHPLASAGVGGAAFLLGRNRDQLQQTININGMTAPLRYGQTSPLFAPATPEEAGPEYQL